MVSVIGIQNAIKLATAKGLELLAIKPYSKHPGDNHLFVALLKNVNKAESDHEFTTHYYNAESQGFCEGHYFHGDAQEAYGNALEDFNARSAANALDNFKVDDRVNVVSVNLVELKKKMETTFNYNHKEDEEDCWTNTVMDALQDLTGLEENLREMFKKE